MKALLHIIAIFFVGVFSLLSGKESPVTSSPEIMEKNDAGFRDFSFVLSEYHKEKDGSQVILFSGTHKGKKVTLCALLSPDWKKNGQIASTVTYQGIVTFVSRGSESDTLVEAIDSIYTTHLGFKRFRQKVSFTGITLEGDPLSPEKGTVAIKLFFESEKADRYAELYFNIFLKEKIVQIHEKDAEYRPAIVKALGI